MKFQSIFLICVASGLALISLSCSSDPDGNEPLILPGDIKSSSIAVVDVSGEKNIAGYYQIDGLLSSNVRQTVGSSKVAATYVPIEAGLRKLSIGGFKDTIRIKEANYYTVMVYNKDSIGLSLDASYHNNLFNAGPQIRWNIADETPSDYRVDIKSDTVLISDVKPNIFTSTLIADKAFLYLYRRGVNKELARAEVPTALNSKETVKFTKGSSAQEYLVEVFSQRVKL
ncbi:hypothetical protein [Sphingobacterium faecale]|uniref:DUF4397 domain-containing protein n=1 Tax=Sphingobacterium faecale TaxID=2803775 RepID=A0ABS1R6N2_9SPHI|nr:hypothetical protein [Sphingobacterium faecale]MBL1409526.1 hypothetical protein [Sphingobacterium faecale]